MRLHLALSRGVTARIAGPIAGFHVLGPNIRHDSSGLLAGINAVASVYFPPAAWELVHAGDRGTLDKFTGDEFIPLFGARQWRWRTTRYARAGPHRRSTS
jgi:hypothetical protein